MSAPTVSGLVVTDLDERDHIVFYDVKLTHPDCGFSGPAEATEPTGALDPPTVDVEHCPGCGETLKPWTDLR